MDKVEKWRLNYEIKRLFRDADWDAKYQAKMRILNLQRKIGVNGNVVLKREGGMRYA